MKTKYKFLISVGCVLLAFGVIFVITLIYHKGPYTAEQLGIETVKSKNDTDGDGIDDYTDIMQSAREYIATNPKYESKYYAGGYPDDGLGVCTDVIWQAFKGAGIDLKALVDADIAENPDAYPGISKPDMNIDFRRVRNLQVFFARNATSLTHYTTDASKWQPGDIVILEPSHIAIVSDKRNRKGVPYIIHHSPAGAVEADDLYRYEIVGHYRYENKG